MFSALDQSAIIAAMPGAISATVGSSTITVDFRTASEAVMFSDGSVEQGKPYCIASSADVTVNSIDHGSAIVISGVTWYCIGKTKKNDGLYRLILSKTHES